MACRGCSSRRGVGTRTITPATNTNNKPLRLNDDEIVIGDVALTEIIDLVKIQEEVEVALKLHNERYGRMPDLVHLSNYYKTYINKELNQFFSQGK